MKRRCRFVITSALLVAGCGAQYTGASAKKQPQYASGAAPGSTTEPGNEKLPGNATSVALLPAPIAEGKRGDDEPPGLAPPRPAPPTPAPAEPKGSAPDPEPLRLARQFQYDITFDQGRLEVTAVKGLRFARPVVTARQMGRYAVELWLGPELIERVRFDFPLMASEDPTAKPKPRADKHAPTITAGLSVTRRILVPASPRATRALLLDRATGEAQELPWPPDAPLADASEPRPPAKAR